MNIQLDIDTETLEVCISIPNEFAKNHNILYLIDKILMYELKQHISKLSKEIQKEIQKYADK
jgi:hypothetical protein